MAVKPSLATNSTLAAIYDAADKSWAGDLSLLAPAQLRSVEPINRSLHCISDWIDAVTQEDSLVDSDAVKAHNLAAQSAITAITNVADGDTLSKIVKLLEYRADNRMLLAFPVGAVYISTVNTNPGTFIGGTWEAFGTGKTLVGIDATDTDFHEGGHTGGSKDAVVLSHTHLAAHDPGGGYLLAYSHTPGANVALVGSYGNNIVSSDASVGVADAGNQNLPPYIVVYMWKRTA
jgi:hypothetical protein